MAIHNEPDDSADDKQHSTRDNDGQVDEDNPDMGNLRDALMRVQEQRGEKIPRAEHSVDVEAPVEDLADNEISSVTEEKQTEGLKPKARAIEIDPDKTAPRKLGEKVDPEVRQTLRRVQAHLLHSQVGLGAKHEKVGLMEVLYHPNNMMSSLNYATPRQKTAWVFAKQVQLGLDYLTERGRTARFQYIEGLYPPRFAKSLDELNLEVESETSLMIYTAAEDEGEKAVQAPETPPHIRLKTVHDIRDAEIWHYVWKNAHYDVFTLGVEPLYVGRDMEAITLGKQIEVLAYMGDFPFGVARITVHEDTAHIVGTAILKEMRTTEYTQMITQAALRAALEAGCTLVFTSGESNEERKVNRTLGFLDFGSIVCYAAKPNSQHINGPQVTGNDPVAKPILNLRNHTQ